MRKHSALLLLFMTSVIASGASAGIFISEPKNNLTTFSEVEILKGVAKNVSFVKVNGRDLEIGPDGSFSCGLVLDRGKNLVEVRASDGSVKELRILKLKNYPDIEALYEGKKHWARSQIIHLASLGIAEGYPDDYFYPANPVTRGELATWVARAKNLKIPVLTEDVYFDVPKEHWRAPYIKAATDAGYLRAYDNATFGIDDPISRRQAAEVAVMSEGYEVVEKIKPLFVDVPQEEKGAFPIYIAKEKGLVLGVSRDIDVFEPDRALTRAEAAVLVSRFKLSSERIRSLFDFKAGFVRDKLCRVNVPPAILSFSLDPAELKNRRKTVVKVRAAIGGREGFFPVSKVIVDLSEIGGAPDAEMHDDASHGDEQKSDLVYSLNLDLEPKESGNKMLTVTAIDRLGWESKRHTYLLVVE